MSIKAVYGLISDSTLFKLKHNGKIVGMRAKWYDPVKKVFHYYDFATQLISDVELRKFLKGKQNRFESLDLIEFKNEVDNKDGTVTVHTTLMTQEEVDSKQQVREFKSTHEAEMVIRSIKEICEANWLLEDIWEE